MVKDDKLELKEQVHFLFLVEQWLRKQHDTVTIKHIIKTRSFYNIRGFYNTNAYRFLHNAYVRKANWAICEMDIKEYIVLNIKMTQKLAYAGKYKSKNVEEADALYKKRKEAEKDFEERTGEALNVFLYKDYALHLK